MNRTSPAQPTAADIVPDSAPPAAPGLLNLKSLSLRGLLFELAATETLLRECPGDTVRNSTVHQQGLIVGELRRRRRRERNSRHHPFGVADAAEFSPEPKPTVAPSRASVQGS